MLKEYFVVRLFCDSCDNQEMTLYRSNDDFHHYQCPKCLSLDQSKRLYPLVMEIFKPR